MTDPSIFIENVKDITREAGNITLKYYITDFEKTINFKADKSPVTIADLEASKFIIAGLTGLSPQIPVISEENNIPLYEVRKKWDWFWLIDPLDGTKEFINRNDEFTINIALIHKKRPVLGVVFAPVLNTLFWAVKDQGAYKFENNAESRLEANKINLKSGNLRIVVSRSHLDQKTKNYLNNFINPVVLSKGSSLKFMDIASGASDLYFRLNNVMEWDTAASHIILTESGASLKNIQNGKNIMYNKKNLKIPGFFVCRE